MIKAIEKYPLFTLFVLVAIMMLPGLGHLKVTIMEARNFITAREMLSEGNWFLTTMNGLPRYEKPPLPSWITAAFGFVFGIKSVFVLRLPGVIMVWLVGVYTYLFSKSILNNKTHSLVNALIVVTSFYVVGITVEAPWDIFTHGFMLIAIYHLYSAYNTNKFSDYSIATLFIACSVLSKGPISVYALFLPFIIAYAVVFGVKNKFLLKTLLALLPGILLGAIWFVYVRLADADSFLEIASVETSNWSSYNVKPFYYYWSFFIQSGIWTIPSFIGLLYPYLKSRVSNLKAYRLSIFWTIFSVILLSVIPEKKSRYLMPVLIPLAINTGFYIQYLITNFTQFKNKKETIPAYLHFGLLGLLGLAAPIGASLYFSDQIFQNLFFFLPVFLLLFGIACLLLYKLYLKSIKTVLYLGTFLYAVLLVIVIPLNPGFAIQNDNYKSITNLSTEAEKENIKVYVLDIITPETVWDYGGIVPLVEEKDSTYILPTDNKFGLLVNDKSLIEKGNYNENYNITYKTTYDINIGKLNTRKHKVRYINYYYIFQKK